MNPKISTLKHIVIDLTKVKDRENFESSERKKACYSENAIRLSVDFSVEIMQARREQNNIFKMLKETNCQLRILYPANQPFKNKGKIKTSTDTQKLREFITSRHVL